MLNCEALETAIQQYILKVNDSLSAKLKLAGFLETDFTVEEAEHLEDEICSILEAEIDDICELAENCKTAEEFAEKFAKFKNKDITAKQLREVLSSHYSNMAPSLIESYIQAVDKELKFVRLSKGLSKWISSWSEELADKMKLTTHQKIEEILSKRLTDGSGIEKIIQDLQSEGIRNERYRARSTAITESLRAHSAASQEAAVQNPCVSSKVWRHSGTRNNHPRPNHVDMDGQVVDKHKPFILVGADGQLYSPMYPRDPVLPAGETVNCHCIAQYIVNEDIFGLSLEVRQQMQEDALRELDETDL